MKVSEPGEPATYPATAGGETCLPSFPEGGLTGHGGFRPAADGVKVYGFSISKLEVICRGSSRLWRWNGPFGTWTHAMAGDDPRTVCGEPYYGESRVTVLREGEITCRACARLLLKRNLRGA